MWLLLVHQIPPEPGYLRVKVRRRLRGVGAVPLKSTVYVLPQGDAAREAFEWLAREIRTSGGDAILSEARLIGGLSDEDVISLFRGERDADYAQISRAAEQIPTGDTAENQHAQLARLRRRMQAVADLDFFQAPGGEAAARAIADAEARLLRGTAESCGPPGITPVDLHGKVWVTRRGVHVDRMASAWLIRRFIDRDARFRFVDPDGYRPAPGEVRFDMYEAEFTHDGDRCTFEVLCALVDAEDRALRAVAEIVHDIDLADGKFARAEAAGIERLVAGIQASAAGDEERVARAADVFEMLFRAFGGAPG